ncbi:hypothetical protein QEZ48_07590 [Aquamicrobium lusatiense]|uniref:hypothetical protein n=1 Tax=Aquamicrobium lusatiense TaxID=89772 RepID=UPI002456302A|nr:hypothetical protein [Aquamicrobium lusatiense]MDH4990692.1 hypothetical protein [Aquamicrobium lusatiense]
MNPFLRRATEYIRDTNAFLAITSPEPLRTFVAKHKRINDLMDYPVRVIGSPGTGKTMMATLVEFRLVEAVLKDQSSQGNRALAGALSAARFADGDRPLVAAIRLPMESEYREFWELPYEPAVKTKLMLSLIQARAILGLLRTITANRYRDVDDIRFVTRPEAEAQLAQIGGENIRDIRDRAREVESLVYNLGASLLPPDVNDIPQEIQKPYQPFETVSEIEITWDDERIRLRPLIILDDVHSLHPDQYAALFRSFAKREIRIGRWLMMRMDALSPSAVFRSSDDEALPGLKQDRDFIDVVMESAANRRGERRQFKRMATDMANRYLQLVDTLRDRGHLSMAGLLSEQAPTLPQGKLNELRELIGRDQRKLKITPTRRETIENSVDAYIHSARATDLTPDVALGMQRVLLYRYAGRTSNQTLELFEDPEPAQPVKASPGVADAARVQLYHRYGRPLHFGISDLCAASGENAELFLQLAGSLVGRMETKAIRNMEPTLTPSQQQDELRLKATDIIANWSFPFSRKVSVLVHKLAEQCVENAMLPNAPLNEGANTIGILEREIGPLLNSEEEIATILKYALAYGAFSAVRDYSQGGKEWCLLELSGPVCLKFGLGFGKGNFLERKVSDLTALIAEAE